MARNRTSDGRLKYQRSASQAYRMFGFDRDRLAGAIPRPKFLFLIRFLRSVGAGDPKEWEAGMTYAVKRFDRPRISVDTQVMNQYNKKRIIQTGIKYGDTKIDFHDSSDQKVMQMWAEYVSYYFGDFRKATDADWEYDVVLPDFKNMTGGFGVTLPKDELNSVNARPKKFFSKVECYQFANGEYSQFDLINPKITSFDPDDMEYASDHNHNLTMNISCEAVIYHNDGRTTPIMSEDANAFIKTIRGGGSEGSGVSFFNGDVIEPEPSNAGVAPNTNLQFPQPSGNPVTGMFGKNNIPNFAAETFSGANNINPLQSLMPNLASPNNLTQAFGKVIPSQFSQALPNASPIGQLFSSGQSLPSVSTLGSFGIFDFGQVATNVTSSLNIPGKVNSIADSIFGKQKIGNTIGQQVLNQVLNKARQPITNAGSGISASLYDIARGAGQRLSNGPNTGIATQRYSDAASDARVNSNERNVFSTFSGSSPVGTAINTPPINGDAPGYDDWV